MSKEIEAVPMREIELDNYFKSLEDKISKRIGQEIKSEVASLKAWVITTIIGAVIAISASTAWYLTSTLKAMDSKQEDLVNDLRDDLRGNPAHAVDCKAQEAREQ